MNKKYNTRHGGPFDRGSADSYYSRSKSPHFYVNGTETSRRIEKDDMSLEEVEAYNAGYEENELHGDKKEWR